MKDNTLIISLLVGLIVVLVIAGVSLLVKINSLSGDRDKELVQKRACEVSLEGLKGDNSRLRGTIEEITTQLGDLKVSSQEKIEALKQENMRLEKLKDKLEDNLKDELMKQRLTEPSIIEPIE